MSLPDNLPNGSNITTAVTVLKETYKSLNTLFNEMDRIAEEEGLIPLTPKFLRWKSDSHSDGWLMNNFIKLYQVDSNTAAPNHPEMQDSDVFGVEVDLDGEEYPQIALIRYSFDYSYWPARLPAVSDHGIFYYPFRDDTSFDIDEENGVWSSKPYAKSIKKYWGIEEAVSMSIPLLSVDSPETIRSEIFEKLLQLSFKSVEAI